MIFVPHVYFFANDIVSLHDLRRLIYVSLEFIHSHFNLTISARINTAQPGSNVLDSLFGVISEKIYGMIKLTSPYQMSGFKTRELVIDLLPISIFGSRNPFREYSPTRVAVYYENEKKED
jgi:hypothetical protein